MKHTQKLTAGLTRKIPKKLKGKCSSSKSMMLWGVQLIHLRSLGLLESLRSKGTIFETCYVEVIESSDYTDYTGNKNILKFNMELEDAPFVGKRDLFLETIILMFRKLNFRGVLHPTSAVRCAPTKDRQKKIRRGHDGGWRCAYYRNAPFSTIPHLQRKYDSNDEMINLGMIHLNHLCKMRSHPPPIFRMKVVFKRILKSTIHILTTA